MYQSILGLSTKLLHAYWVSGSAGPALVAEDHGQGHMSLIRGHMVDICACLHSGSVWPFSCKGKSRTKVLQAAAC